MDKNIMLPTTLEIANASDILEEAIRRYLDIRENTVKRWGRFESEVECVLLFNLVIRNIEAIITLAREDLVLYPAAMGLARIVFEISTKILWILNPTDPFESEVRFLAILNREISDRNELMGYFSNLHIDTEDFSKRTDAIQDFRAGVFKALPKPYSELRRVPGFKKMIKSLGREEEYALYINFSQFPHGTHMATDIYRKNLGTKMELGEFIKPSDWSIIFNGCWRNFVLSGSLLLSRQGGDVRALFPDEFVEKMENALGSI